MTQSMNEDGAVVKIESPREPTAGSTELIFKFIDIINRKLNHISSVSYLVLHDAACNT